MAEHICQAEDQGGWPICQNPATLQTKRTFQTVTGKSIRRYYCEEHRTNRHVWVPDDELEPIQRA